ncbi:hypothetical protein [Nocardia arthritidis]|uniref:Uncharacterized protein n=1 Tax=Nocardia arthritidis TaxID=228602 RepID=A0A6G9Y9C3_9NOCA|nr:hypothetical protein [Nocardia arthritidis]QIS09822.1 hypothetical protein F5544_09610 [Nocardia arthritidis]
MPADPNPTPDFTGDVEDLCRWYRQCGLTTAAWVDGYPKLETDASIGAILMPGAVSRATRALLTADIPVFQDRLWGHHVALVAPDPRRRISPGTRKLLRAHAVIVLPPRTRLLLPRKLSQQGAEEFWVTAPAPAPANSIPSMQLMLALIRECVDPHLKARTLPTS